MMSKADKFRMVEWLAFSVLFYLVAIMLAKADILPQIQTLAWKSGHVTGGAFIGYWIDRIAFRNRITDSSDPMIHLRRAIIIAATMYTLGSGL